MQWLPHRTPGAGPYTGAPWLGHLESSYRCTADRNGLSMTQFDEATFKIALHPRGTVIVRICWLARS